MHIYKCVKTIRGFRDSVPIRELHVFLLKHTKISTKTSRLDSGVQGESNIYMTVLEATDMF